MSSSSTLDEQLRQLGRGVRRVLRAVPGAIGVVSIAVAVLYVGFIVAELVGRPSDPATARLVRAIDHAAVIAAPVIGTATGLASIALRPRNPWGWLGLMLNVAVGLTLILLGHFLTGMGDH